MQSWNNKENISFKKELNVKFNKGYVSGNFLGGGR